MANKYQWDLTKIIKNDEEFDKLYDEILKMTTELEAYKGKIMSDAKTLYQFLQLDETLNLAFDRIIIYANFYSDLDTKDSKGQSLRMRVEKLSEMVSPKLSFIRPEMLNTDYQVVLDFIKSDKQLEKYKFFFELMFRYKEHTLSTLEEEIISEATNDLGTGSEVFYNIDNADVKFGKIKDEKGNKIELTHGNYRKLIESKDRRVRKDTFMTLYKYYSGLKNSIAAAYKGKVKENFFISKIRKYDNPLSMSLFGDAIDVKVYKNLITAVHNKLDIIYDYFEIKKQMLRIDELHLYDLYADIVTVKNNEISYDEAFEVVLKGLEPLGEKYATDLKQAIDNNWADVFPKTGKKGGAYSWGMYGLHPHVLLNFDGTTGYLETIAHEFGHAMHSYYSNQKQEYIYCHYPIFLAEVASTVNELLLNDYLYKNSKTKEEKILYLAQMLDRSRLTIFRQTMFAEFEMMAHDKEEAGIPLTEKELSDTYYELNKLYHGKGVKVDEEIRYEWLRIPHFYSSFYVYKYATGLMAALAIANDIINKEPGAKERYLEFLSSGGSDYPINTLKKVGVDMTKPEAISKALMMIENKIKELKELIK